MLSPAARHGRPEAANRRRFPSRPTGDDVMAKGQQRSGKEKKKPKQDKSKAGTTQSAYKSEFSSKPASTPMPPPRKA
jgi:hypothetical protein